MLKLSLVGLLALSVLSSATCGGSSSPTSSTTSTTTQTQANRAPVISSMTITSYGVAQLSSFSFAASATDADGDSLTYTWSVAGNPFTGSSGTIAFTTGGSGTATLTVSDGRGGTASDSRTFVVGTMAGSWVGTLNGFAISMTLTQPVSGSISGTWALSALSGTALSGTLDPAVANRIDINSNVTMRLKVTTGSFNDFTITGALDQTGRRFVGSAQGSGFTGQAVVLNK